MANAINVGEGIKNLMDQNGDHPFDRHEIGSVKDSTGENTLYSFERCQGTKGNYTSSNASGQWENVFIPFG